MPRRRFLIRSDGEPRLTEISANPAIIALICARMKGTARTNGTTTGLESKFCNRAHPQVAIVTASVANTTSPMSPNIHRGVPCERFSSDDLTHPLSWHSRNPVKHSPVNVAPRKPPIEWPRPGLEIRGTRRNLKQITPSVAPVAHFECHSIVGGGWGTRKLGCVMQQNSTIGVMADFASGIEC